MRRLVLIHPFAHRRRGAHCGDRAPELDLFTASTHEYYGYTDHLQCHQDRQSKSAFAQLCLDLVVDVAKEEYGKHGYNFGTSMRVAVNSKSDISQAIAVYLFGFAQGCGAQLGGRLLREAVATIGGLSVAYSYVCLEHDHR